MSRSESAIWGIILVLAGMLLLVWTLDLAAFRATSLIGLLFAVAGAGFLGLCLSSRAHWWAAIPGMVLLALATLVGLEGIMPIGRWGGTLLFGAVASAFWLVYLRIPGQWWAVIPAGAMSTAALVAAPLGLRDATLVWGYLWPLLLILGGVYLLLRRQRLN